MRQILSQEATDFKMLVEAVYLKKTFRTNCVSSIFNKNQIQAKLDRISKK